LNLNLSMKSWTTKSRSFSQLSKMLSTPWVTAFSMGEI
jgi:hypothetical protein